jgi:[ribosomal protein S5]-alanine N-acetyltransferase
MRLILPECIVRPYAPGDEAALARHANNARVTANMRDRFPHPYTIDDARAWIAFTLEQRPLTNWAVEVEGAVGGGIGLIPQEDIFRRSAEIGYWLGEELWGRGIATAAVRALSTYAFETFDLCRLFATVFDSNAASARVLEKAGFVREGRLRQAVTKNGRTIDALLYARVADTHVRE